MTDNNIKPRDSSTELIRCRPTVSGETKLAPEAAALLEVAKKRLANLDEAKVLHYARRIADFEKSRAIKPAHLAEALQYREITPDVNTVRSDALFNRRASGTEVADRMREVGITDGLDNRLPRLRNEVKEQIRNLPQKTRELLATAISRSFYNSKIETGRLGVKELRAIDETLDMADRIRQLAGSEMIQREHLAEALQYRNLRQFIRTASAPHLARLKEILGKEFYIYAKGVEQTFYRAFRPEGTGGLKILGEGMYVSPTEEGARYWGKDVRPVKAIVKKPLVLEPWENLGIKGWDGSTPIADWAKSRGFDAIIHRSVKPGHDHINLLVANNDADKRKNEDPTR